MQCVNEGNTRGMFHIEFFWVVMLCSVVVRCQCFIGSCCLHFQKTSNLAATFSLTVYSTTAKYHNTTWCYNPELHLNLHPEDAAAQNSETQVSYHDITQHHNTELHLNLHPEDGHSNDLWNVGILPQHYTASQPKRTQLEPSPL
jgi:hypothetical protein